MPNQPCPDRRLLRQLLAYSLSGEEVATLQQHLDDCESCQEALQTLAAGGAAVLPEGNADALHQSAASLRLSDVVDRLKELPSPPAFAFLGPSDRPGSIGQLASYEVIGEVGRGGMGIILKAIDPALGRTLAIKVLAPESAAQSDAEQRFLREARAAAAVDHVNVVAIHAVGQANGVSYIVMQFVEGESLGDRFARLGKLSVDQVIGFTQQLAAGLGAAHARGLVHRDIKPANVLLETSTGCLKLTDFGLAKAVDDIGVTRAGVVAGTPEFMSPEQAKGQSVDHRSDLFSLGTMLYVALSGQSPFAAESSMATLQRVCNDEPPALSEIRPDVSDWLSQLVHRLMSKEPSRRYQSCAELAEALRAASTAPTQVAAAAQTSIDDPRVESTTSRHRLMLPLLGSLLLVPLLLAATELAGVTNFFRDDESQSAAEPIEDASGSFENLVLETNATASPAITSGFVIVSTRQPYATLNEAIAAASSGDVIEVYGNEQYGIEPINITGRAITIRAAGDNTPVLTVAGGERADTAAITSDSLLVVEGLEFHWSIQADQLSRDASDQSTIVVSGGSLMVANSRFVAGRRTACLSFDGIRCEIRNCELVAEQGRCISWLTSRDSQLESVNTSYDGGSAISVMPGEGAGKLQLHHNQFSTDYLMRLLPDSGVQPLEVHAAQNVFDVDCVCEVVYSAMRFEPTKPAFMHRLMAWTEYRNVYASECDYIRIRRPSRRSASEVGPQNLAEWNLLWRLSDTESIAYDISAERPVHAGAEEQLVGCGDAYEAWKASADYAGWRQRAGEWNNAVGSKYSADVESL